jgi:hypothetical protein
VIGRFLVDECLTAGLAEGNWSGGDIFPHQSAETVDGLCIEHIGLGPRHDAAERFPGSVSVDFERCKAIFENVIQLSAAVFDHRIKPPQLVLGRPNVRSEG